MVINIRSQDKNKDQNNVAGEEQSTPNNKAYTKTAIIDPISILKSSLKLLCN